MSISKKPIVMERIKEATKESRIAVFRARESGTYNAVFADTLYTQSLLSRDEPGLIGVFYGVMGADEFSYAVKGENS